MSAKMRVLFIEAEGDGVLAALQQLAALFPQPVTGTLELTAEPSEPAAIAPAPKRHADKGFPLTRQEGRERGDAIVAALKFRPLRVAEIADAICSDKRDVPATTQRLYPALARLVEQKRIVKKGREYHAR
jgi:hypothetical protein